MWGFDKLAGSNISGSSFIERVLRRYLPEPARAQM
jgi:hypothetical protein